jgi:hypothetical protein
MATKTVAESTAAMMTVAVTPPAVSLAASSTVLAPAADVDDVDVPFAVAAQLDAKYTPPVGHEEYTLAHAPAHHKYDDCAAQVAHVV